MTRQFLQVVEVSHVDECCSKVAAKIITANLDGQLPRVRRLTKSDPREYSNKARACELFREGRSTIDLIIALRQPFEAVRAWPRSYIAESASLFVAEPTSTKMREALSALRSSRASSHGNDGVSAGGAARRQLRRRREMPVLGRNCHRARGSSQTRGFAVPSESGKAGARVRSMPANCGVVIETPSR